MFKINWPTEINTSDIFVNVAIDLNNIIELQTSEIADNIKAGAIFINMSKQEKFPLNIPLIKSMPWEDKTWK